MSDQITGEEKKIVTDRNQLITALHMCIGQESWGFWDPGSTGFWKSGTRMQVLEDESVKAFLRPGCWQFCLISFLFLAGSNVYFSTILHCLPTKGDIFPTKSHQALPLLP